MRLSAFFALNFCLLLILSPPALAGDKLFDLRIEDGAVAESQRVLRVSQGDRVLLLFTADEGMELHLHGYDLEVFLERETPRTLEMNAHASGRYPLEVHSRAGGGGEAVLLYLEVYPD